METEIQSEVDALKARFVHTKELYREVCALLFFRYGLTPATNKLYQFVRKGSMSAPADALTKFWDDLRSKARVEIDHPDLPPELKAIAAEAIASIWRQAAAGARAELAELRADVERAEAESNDLHEAAEASRLEVINLEQELHEAEEAGRSKKVELEEERRAHAASAARVQELQRLVDELRAEQGRQRESFSADLAKSREAVEVANARADAGERRALLEVDQERQAGTRAEKQTEAVRTQLAAAESRQRDSALEGADTITRLQSKLNSAEAASAVAADANRGLSDELRTMPEQLVEARARPCNLRQKHKPSVPCSIGSRRFRTASLGRRHPAPRACPNGRGEHPRMQKPQQTSLGCAPSTADQCGFLREERLSGRSAVGSLRPNTCTYSTSSNSCTKRVARPSSFGAPRLRLQPAICCFPYVFCLPDRG